MNARCGRALTPPGPEGIYLLMIIMHESHSSGEVQIHVIMLINCENATREISRVGDKE